jgi:hypothetical protein
MTDPEPPIDDDVVSAVLDGEATPDERALVEGSAAGRRRLADLRAVAEEVGRPVDPLPSATIDRLVGRALDAGPQSARGEVAPLHRARSARRWGAAVAAAAAAVLVAGGIVAVARELGGGSSSYDASSASDATAMADAESADSPGGPPDQQTAESSTSGANDGSATAAPSDGDIVDLGTQADAESALRSLEQLGSGSDTAFRNAQQFVALAGACGDALATPDQTVAVVAVAVLPSGRATVLITSPGVPRWLVVDDASCSVLLEQPA